MPTSVPRSAGLRPQSEDCRFFLANNRHLITRLAAAAVLASTLAACNSEPKTENHIRPVKAVVVTEQAGDVVRTFSGTVRARVESNLGFRVPGKILERKVNIGDTVKAGQLVARLDEKDLVLSEDSAKASVAAAKTRLAVAKDAHHRSAVLLPKGYISKAIVDQRKLELDAAQSALDAAEAQSRQASNSTGYANLNADKDGIVSSVYAEAGQVVAAGTPIVTLAETGEIEVALAVPEQEVTRLKTGAPVELTLWADGTIKTQGAIREIAGQADPSLRTYAVRVSVPNSPAGMRLGMTATALLKLGTEAPHIVVPLTALTQVDGRDAVFVADRVSSTVAPRFITTGGVTDRGVKIVSGLQAGEIVITGGVQFLTAGKKVRLPQEVVKTASAE